MTEIKTVVYLFPYPFEKRDYDRFGVETFVNSGFDVLVWDMTDYFVPEYRTCAQESPDPLEFSGLYKFDSLNAMLEAIDALSPGVCFFNFLGYDSKSFPILLALSKRHLPYANFRINSVPDFGGETTTGTMTDRLQAFVASLKRRLKTLSRERLKNYAFKLSPFGKSGLEPPNLVVVDGEKSYRAAIKSKASQTDIVKAHAFDYDLFLKLKDQRTHQNGSTAVFLDEYFPFHPDYLYVGISPGVTPEVYFPLMRRFFKTLEDRFDLKVVVAAHPRSCYDNAEEYFGQREVVRGRTAELVRDASLILLSCSTAVNFAVLFNKPTLFITTDQVNQQYRPMIKTMANFLGSPLLNLNQTMEVNLEKVFALSDAGYDRYRKEFIKMDDSPPKYFWEIIRDRLSDGASTGLQ